MAKARGLLAENDITKAAPYGRANASARAMEAFARRAVDEATGAFERYGRRTGDIRRGSLGLLNQAGAKGMDPLTGAGMKALGLLGYATAPLAVLPTGDEWRERLQKSGRTDRLSQSIGGMLGDLPSAIDPHLMAGGGILAAASLAGKAGKAGKVADVADGAGDAARLAASSDRKSLREARAQGITPTTKNTQRIAFPGIYKHPNELTDDAAALVAPESPALKGLFGVTRDDLYQMNKGRKGNVDARAIFPAGARGSEAAGNVITDKNAQRLVDAMSVAEQRAPQLTNPMDAWYVMDPAFQRLEQLVGREEAIRRFNDLNAFTSMASPASDVITEMNRGTTANYLNRRGRFDDFEKHSTTPVGKRDGEFPSDISGLKPHPYGGTAHSQPMRKYVDGGLLDNGFLNVQTSKVPTYHMASGVPQTGFQTNVPVGDAHFARAIGLPDVRNMLTLKGKPVIPQANATMPEISTLTPWWQQKVVSPLGIESVPGQARAWGLFSPQSGVDTPIGAPKLELMAAEIDRLARQAGVDPAQLRDAILMGEAGLGNNPAMLQGLLSKR